jgi:hypothetical protein
MLVNSLVSLQINFATTIQLITFTEGPVSDHEEIEQQTKRAKKKKAPVILQLDENSYPMLPDFENGARPSLDKQKDIVRAFLNGHYRKRWNFSRHPVSHQAGIFTGNPKSQVPWGRLLEDTGSFVLDEYLPEGMSLRDPSKFVAQDLRSLLDHWDNRKNEGKTVFTFSHYLGKDGEMIKAKKIRDSSSNQPDTPILPDGANALMGSGVSKAKTRVNVSLNAPRQGSNPPSGNEQETNSGARGPPAASRVSSRPTKGQRKGQAVPEEEGRKGTKASKLGSEASLSKKRTAATSNGSPSKRTRS